MTEETIAKPKPKQKARAFSTDPHIGLNVRVPKSLSRSIAAICKSHGLTRSQATRLLLRRGLNSLEK